MATSDLHHYEQCGAQQDVDAQQDQRIDPELTPQDMVAIDIAQRLSLTDDEREQLRPQLAEANHSLVAVEQRLESGMARPDDEWSRQELTIKALHMRQVLRGLDLLDAGYSRSLTQAVEDARIVKNSEKHLPKEE